MRRRQLPNDNENKTLGTKQLIRGHTYYYYFYFCGITMTLKHFTFLNPIILRSSEQYIKYSDKFIRRRYPFLGFSQIK